MSKRVMGFGLIGIFGILAIGASFYGTWELRQMIEETGKYYRSDFMDSVLNGTTLPVGPQGRFLDSDLFGLIAPNTLAMIGTLALVFACFGLKAGSEQTDPRF